MSSKVATEVLNIGDAELTSQSSSSGSLKSCSMRLTIQTLLCAKTYPIGSTLAKIEFRFGFRIGELSVEKKRQDPLATV